MIGGYTLENAGRLLDDLREQVLSQDAIPLESNLYGELYEIRGSLVGPSGRKLYVRTIWMTEHLFGRTKFITLTGQRSYVFMKYVLFSDMALSRDLPAHGLRRGDVVRLVDCHPGPGGTEGYSIEVLNAVGETVTVTTVDAAALEPLSRDEVFSVRRLRSSAA